MNKVPVLFDANGSYGKKSSGVAEFPTIQQRLDYMNRFGIGRALVWNVETLQDYALAGNRRLLDEIARTPGAPGRIIPALSISGLSAYERGGIETMARQMKESGSRALRFVSVFTRLTLGQLEPVLRGIRQRKPFLVLRHDQATVPDLLEFTAMFPEVSVVLTEVMWGQCIIVFDLMRRRPNILVDNSWLHSNGAIEQVVRHFGAERLVFGTGLKSHNGAPIAALARADITESERRLIACGNLERLTGLKRGASVPATVPVGNTLWPRYLEGKPLGVDTVDAHGHLGPYGGYVVESHEEDKQVPLALKTMDATGIRTMVISGVQALMGGPVEGNDLLESVMRPHVGRLQGYVAFNPFYADELMPQLDRYFSGSVFVGFKTLCDYWAVPITDPRFKPMWVYANKHRLPVLSHTWTSAYDSPAMFQDLAKRYPQVSFILGHSGGSDVGRQEAETLARKHRNVFLEWCGSFCSSFAWEKSLETVPVAQVVFGTDAVAHDVNWELGRLLSLDVPDKTLIPILGQNMRQILARRKR